MAAVSTDSVVVGCKIPNGFIMKAFVMVEAYEPVMGGGMRKVMTAAPDPRFPDVKLNGPAIPFNTRSNFDVKAGYAFTRVSKAFWEAWYAVNKNMDYCKNKMIIVSEKQEDTIAKARELKGNTSGMEPMKRQGLNGESKDPRMKLVRPEITISEETKDD